MLKKIIPSLVIAALATGCIVHTHSAGRRCQPGWRPAPGGGCEKTPTRRGPPPDKVIIRDHRR